MKIFRDLCRYTLRDEKRNIYIIDEYQVLEVVREDKEEEPGMIE